jgi:hypothetical protein
MKNETVSFITDYTRSFFFFLLPYFHIYMHIFTTIYYF